LGSLSAEPRALRGKDPGSNPGSPTALSLVATREPALRERGLSGVGVFWGINTVLILVFMSRVMSSLIERPFCWAKAFSC
jgi:hypothetical protein